MEQTGSRRTTEDNQPRIEILWRRPADGSTVVSFVEEFISSEEKLLLSQSDAQAMAVRDMEEMITSEGYDPEFQPEADSIQFENAQHRVLDAEPDVDSNILARLRKFYEFLCSQTPSAEENQNQFEVENTLDASIVLSKKNERKSKKERRKEQSDKPEKRSEKNEKKRRLADES